MWRLTIETDLDESVTVPLVRDEYLIGRADDCDIQLTDRNVSRHHARLRRTDKGDYVVEDDASQNGTYVTAHARSNAQPDPLRPNDALFIGDCALRIDVDSELDPRGRAEPAPARITRPAHLLVMPKWTIEGPAAGASFPLKKKRTTVGSTRYADIVVDAPSNALPIVYAVIEARRNGVFELRPNHVVSRNGERVNERKAIQLAPGDLLFFGAAPFRFVPEAEIVRVEHRGTMQSDRASPWITYGVAAMMMVVWGYIIWRTIAALSAVPGVPDDVALHLDLHATERTACG